MIPIRDYSDYMQTVADAIPAISDFFLVVQDNHAMDRLKDKPGIYLLAVVPNAQGRGDVGSISFNNSAYLFVLEKRRTDATAAKELDQYERTQDIIMQIRERIESDAENGCNPFTRLQAGSIQIDPEYNAFAGWNGWSMQFTF
jgi:hypothetical protein